MMRSQAETSKECGDRTAFRGDPGRPAPSRRGERGARGPALFGGVAMLALLAAPALADAVPHLDIERTCKSANQANVGLSDKANEDGCLRSERDAKREAEKNWDTYKPAAKAQCENQFKAGGYPSYVEMVTCLELASGSVPTGGTGVGGGSTAPGGPRAGGSDITREPAPSQRTNPIEVLDRK